MKLTVLDDPLMRLSPSDSFNVRHAVNSTLIIGQTGSGKTSASGRFLLGALLECGLGGLVLTTKATEDREMYLKCFREAGREQDVKIVDATGAYQFNVLQYLYESRAASSGIEDIVDFVLNLAELGARSDKSGANEAYWQSAMEQQLRNTATILDIGEGRITLASMLDFINSLPIKQDPQPSETNKPYYVQVIEKAVDKQLDEDTARDLQHAVTYIEKDYLQLSEKQRASIKSIFTATIDGLCHRPFYRLFSTGTNLTPEDTLKGTIILVDLPVDTYQKTGRIAQLIWKLAWQTAIRRRTDKNDPDFPPSFLWVDECQNFITTQDWQFQAVARSSRACTVYLTQSIAGLYAELGGERARHQVDALLSNFGTKIFHACDHITSEYAASVVGRTLQRRANENVTIQHQPILSYAQTMMPSGNNGGSTSLGTTEVIEYQILPTEFSQLRTGGVENQRCVDAIIHRTGKVWNATGTNYLRVIFMQED